MKTQLHTQNELIADCIIALNAWREADEERLTRPSPEARHREREFHSILDKYPDAVRTEAEICVSRRAA